MTAAQLVHAAAVSGLVGLALALLAAVVAVLVKTEPGSLPRYVHRCRYHGRHVPRPATTPLALTAGRTP